MIKNDIAFNTGITGGIPTVSNNEVKRQPSSPRASGVSNNEAPLPNKAAIAAVSPRSRSHFPTAEQLKKKYADIVSYALENHTAKQLKRAPSGAAKMEGIDITPKGIFGGRREVFPIGLKLYLKISTVSAEMKPKWYYVGPLPMY